MAQSRQSKIRYSGYDDVLVKKRSRRAKTMSEDEIINATMEAEFNAELSAEKNMSDDDDGST